jgi:DNA polymerase I-like protein with 3'-5' exonuclease and polymerase domains
MFKEAEVGLFKDLKDRGVFTGYERFVVELEPVLEAMSKRGIPVPRDAWEETRDTLEARRGDIEDAMQALIPEECRPFHPKQGYKKEPKGAIIGGVTEHAGERAVWGKRWFDATRRIESLNTTKILELTEERWVKLLPWSPSPKNLITYIKYMARTQPHPRNRLYVTPVSFKTGKETTDQLELARLAKKTGDLLLLITQDYREYSTIIDNHIKNWEPRADGRVHPTFYYETGTGQLASRRPNVQNAPKHKKETADLFRGMVRARPGHCLLEFDYKSFHVHTLAFEAQDADLLRLARLDVHSFVTAHLLHLPDANVCLKWDDDKLGAYLAGIKKAHKEVRDAKVKHAFLGYDNGMGWKKLYNQYMEFFNSQGEAKQVMALLDTLFPKSKAYRERICLVAHDQGYLLSRYGCIRWFWEVFKWEGGKYVSGGDDHEAALSFFTQNDAHCYLKDALLRLDGLNALKKYGFMNTIHDSLMFECPLALRDEAIAVIAPEMEKNSPTLIDPVVAPNGLSVAVGVSVGENWAEMKEIDWRAHETAKV